MKGKKKGEKKRPALKDLSESAGCLIRICRQCVLVYFSLFLIKAIIIIIITIAVVVVVVVIIRPSLFVCIYINLIAAAPCF